MSWLVLLSEKDETFVPFVADMLYECINIIYMEKHENACMLHK